MNQKIYSYSLALLARQDYSEYKLRQKLRTKEFIPHEIDEVILELKEKQYIREDNYRRLFIRKWMIKGESPEKIRMRGAQEKLSFEKEDFENASDELGITSTDNIEKLIAKKLRLKDIPSDYESKSKLRDKVIRYLISKGHSYDLAKRALAPYFETKRYAE